MSWLTISELLSAIRAIADDITGDQCDGRRLHHRRDALLEIVSITAPQRDPEASTISWTTVRIGYAPLLRHGQTESTTAVVSSITTMRAAAMYRSRRQ